MPDASDTQAMPEVSDTPEAIEAQKTKDYTYVTQLPRNAEYARIKGSTTWTKKATIMQRSGCSM